MNCNFFFFFFVVNYLNSAININLNLNPSFRKDLSNTNGHLFALINLISTYMFAIFTILKQTNNVQLSYFEVIWAS